MSSVFTFYSAAIAPFDAWRDGTWALYSGTKHEYTYDTNGNKTSDFYYVFSNGDWIVKWNAEYSYDANGNQTSYASYSWWNGESRGSEKTESTYDDNNNITSYTQYWWDWGNNDWEFSYKIVYYYSDHTPESIAQITSDAETAPRKQLLPDGRIVIVRDGRSYNVGGQVVK